MNDGQDQQSQPEQTPKVQPGAAESAAAGEVATPEASVTLPYAQYEELEELARERDDYLRRLQRAVADYQNLQKRIERFQEAARESALRSLARDILPVADGLTRAMEAAERADGAQAIVEGLRLVEKDLYAALASIGIRPVDALGQTFNPHFHEAAAQTPVAGVPPNTVVRELRKGFLLGQAVVRPAQVVVSTALPPGAVDSSPPDA